MWFLVPFLATIGALLGNYWLAQKQIKGWWTHVVTTGLWVAYGLHIADPAVWIACSLYLPFDIYGIWKWNKSEYDS